MLERLDLDGLNYGCRVEQYKGSSMGVFADDPNCSSVLALFKDGEAEVRISYHSNGIWYIMRCTPDKKTNMIFDGKYWETEITVDNMEQKFKSYPKYRQACEFMRQAHSDLITKKDINHMNTLAKKKVVEYAGRQYKLSNPKCKGLSRVVTTEWIDKGIKIELSYDGLYFMQSRYKTNNDTKPYWRTLYHTLEIDSTKYASIFKALKMLRNKAYGTK